jgi:hypothetical protein
MDNITGSIDEILKKNSLTNEIALKYTLFSSLFFFIMFSGASALRDILTACCLDVLPVFKNLFGYGEVPLLWWLRRYTCTAIG